MNRPDLMLWGRLAIIAISAAVLAAGVLYLVAGFQAEAAQQDLEQSKADALRHIEERQKAIVDGLPIYIASPFRVAPSPADEYRTEILRIRYQALVNRRGFAEAFVARGVILLAVLGSLYVFVGNSGPRRLLDPTG